MHSAIDGSAQPRKDETVATAQPKSGLGLHPRAALTVGVVAAGVRSLWVILYARAPAGLSDPFIYLQMGNSLAEGNGYTSLLGRPTAYYPPGYPLFVGAVQRASELFGQGSRLILILGLSQAVLGGVAAAALVIAGNQLRSSRYLGVTAGLLFAFWPNLIIHSGLVLSETLFLSSFCVLLAVLFLWTNGRELLSNAQLFLLIAAILGSTAVCTLVRPQSVVVIVPAAALAWLIAGFGWRRALQGSGLLVVGMLLAILPWTVRNAEVMNKLIPMSTNTGDNFCIGFHEAATGGFSISAACATQKNYTDGPQVEAARDSELRLRTLRWITKNPGEIPELSFKKLWVTFSHDADAVFAWESYGEDPHLSDLQRSSLNWISNLFYWAVLSLSILGAVIVLRDRKALNAQRAQGLLLVFAFAFGALLPVFFFGHERFKIPVLPCLLLLASLAIQSLCDRAMQGQRSDAETL
ncbi:MAG: hypothetical protein WD029_09615 [Microthrixaceae bacterium]